MLARLGVRHGSRPQGVDHLGVAAGPLGFHVRLAADPREERRKAVVVVLAPFLERMVVALGALQSHPQEHLRRVVDERTGFAELAIPLDRRRGLRAAAGGEDSAHELVVGHVLRQALADPVVEVEGC